MKRKLAPKGSRYYPKAAMLSIDEKEVLANAERDWARAQHLFNEIPITKKLEKKLREHGRKRVRVAKKGQTQ